MIQLRNCFVNLANRCQIKRYFVVIIVFSVFIVWFLAPMSYMIWNFYHEKGKTIHSTCNNRFRSFNGRVYDIQLFQSGFVKSFSIYNHLSTSDRRLQSNSLRSSLVIRKESVDNHKQPVILWGSHHKTGTYLAQKIFSKLCSMMKWCCVFHVTRDSIRAINDTLFHEDVHIIGHNQWIWYPEEIIGDGNYKFIHFYRDPYRKILSGTRYHGAGVEYWTKKKKLLNKFHHSCESSLYQYSKTVTTSNPEYKSFLNPDMHINPNFKSDLQQASSVSAPAIVTANNHSNIRRYRRLGNNEVKIVSRDDVIDHCESVHLCETCCRREHELEVVHPSSDPHLYSLPYIPSRKYTVRSFQEYSFLCERLGTLNKSIQYNLLNSKAADALAIEAALDYYENLRMARIFNHTKHDPNSINIDLDELTRNFAATTRTILNHLDLKISSTQMESILSELSFFDLNNSPLYRWSMAALSHLNEKSASYNEDMFEVLNSHDEIKRIYEPIMKLFAAVET